MVTVESLLGRIPDVVHADFFFFMGDSWLHPNCLFPLGVSRRGSQFVALRWVEDVILVIRFDRCVEIISCEHECLDDSSKATDHAHKCCAKS